MIPETANKVSLKISEIILAKLSSFLKHLMLFFVTKTQSVAFMWS